MTIESIVALSSGTTLTPVTTDAGAEATSFSEWVRNELRAVNNDMIAADDGVRRLAVGDPVNLHQVMVNLERAKLRFDLVLQVRNKLLEAYQDVMRMQV